jgi:hypothetical protein
MAQGIQPSLHLYAWFILVVCVFVDISSSTSYVPGICLHYTRFCYWNYVCLSHVLEISRPKLCMLISCPWNFGLKLCMLVSFPWYFVTEIIYACLIYLKFRDWNYICFSHFREILLLQSSMFVSYVWNFATEMMCACIISVRFCCLTLRLPNLFLNFSTPCM